MTYRETIRYLESFINYEKIASYPYKESLKLERIKAFLSSIGNPQYDLKCIHIAGSKGKGSTCAFIAYILKEAGFKVGLYTSPHLSDFRERIRILRPSSLSLRQAGLVLRPRKADVFEGMISRQGLTDLVEKIKPSIEEFNKNSGFGALSFFEVYTAIAFVYFKANKVDFAVLETGLGGRLDATNTVNPIGCAITPISYEHTQKLGNTLREIATEKAGIIKHRPSSLSLRQAGLVPVSPAGRPRPSLIVISAPQEKEALEVLKSRCKEIGARLFAVGKDIIYKETENGFSVKGMLGQYPRLKIKLLGRHQVINACVAIGVIEALQNYNIKISRALIKKGLYNTVWQGRCEVISKNPLIVLDGAQNVASIQALKKAVKENFKFNRLIIVLGVSNDKNIAGICANLAPIADEVVLTKADNPRALAVDKIEDAFRGQINNNLDIVKTGCVKEAVKTATNKAEKKDLILVTGSLFVVAEARFLLKSNIKN